MAKQKSPDLIPRDGVIFGCFLGILIPAVFVFVYFLITDGVVSAVDGAMFMIFIVGIFTGSLGMVIGAILVVSWRLSNEEREKAIHILIPRLGGVVGLSLGFWIPATIIFNNASHPVPGIFNGLCVGAIAGSLGAMSGVYLAKLSLKFWSR